MGEPKPPYNSDDAQEEAIRMQERVASGQAWSLAEALKQIELENGELAPILVLVEQLIPGIKPKGSTKLLQQEESKSGENWPDVYAEDLPRKLNQYVPDEFFGRFFEGQVVVDLGAGNMYGYYAAAFGKAKGYIAVDKFKDLSRDYQDPKKVQERLNDFWGLAEPIIPVATEVEDMLLFLRRLPDNSVSIISSGHSGLIENRKYKNEVRNEMKRVLDPKGYLVANNGIAIDDNLATELMYGTSPPFQIIAKKKLEKESEALYKTPF